MSEESSDLEENEIATFLLLDRVTLCQSAVWHGSAGDRPQHRGLQVHHAALICSHLHSSRAIP